MMDGGHGPKAPLPTLRFAVWSFLMVRSAASRVSNHEAAILPLILRDAAKRPLLRMRPQSYRSKLSTRYAATRALSRARAAVGVARSTRYFPSASHASTFRSTAGEWWI